MVRRRHKVTTTFSPTHRCRRHREKKERKRKKILHFPPNHAGVRVLRPERTNDTLIDSMYEEKKKEREKKNWSRDFEMRVVTRKETAHLAPV